MTENERLFIEACAEYGVTPAEAAEMPEDEREGMVGRYVYQQNPGTGLYMG